MNENDVLRIAKDARNVAWTPKKKALHHNTYEAALMLYEDAIYCGEFLLSTSHGSLYDYCKMISDSKTKKAELDKQAKRVRFYLLSALQSTSNFSNFGIDVFGIANR